MGTGSGHGYRRQGREHRDQDIKARSRQGKAGRRRVTGDDDLKAEGRADQAEASVKKAGENVKDAVEDVKDAFKK